jgi:hypothetical protein
VKKLQSNNFLKKGFIMKFNEIAMLAEGINDFTPYGGTPLGVLAMKKGVIDTKDSYARRERLVREWANEKWGNLRHRPISCPKPSTAP